MATAIWCLLVAVLMPLVLGAIAKATGSGRYDNRAPRAYLERQQGVSQRADWAQRNSWEALAMFTAALAAAFAAGVAGHWLANLSLAFIAARLLYGICYLKNWANARSLCWFAGLFCCLWLLVLAGLGA